jgi:hypothetical protein
MNKADRQYPATRLPLGLFGLHWSMVNPRHICPALLTTLKIVDPARQGSDTLEKKLARKVVVP